MNHSRFPKEDHLPDWACRDNKITKGDRAGCETWCLALREERRRMVVENRFSEEVFGIGSEKVKGDWKKLHKEGAFWFVFLACYYLGVQLKERAIVEAVDNEWKKREMKSGFRCGKLKEIWQWKI